MRVGDQGRRWQGGEMVEDQHSLGRIGVNMFQHCKRNREILELSIVTKKCPDISLILKVS